MNNILKSDFYRLFKSKSYYICTIVALLLMVTNIFIYKWQWETFSEQLGMETFPYKDGITYGLTVFSNGNILMIIAIFTAIFVTAEFAHGTMKNAVSKGFSKLQIYLSKLVTMTVAVILILLVNFIVSTIAGVIVIGSLGEFTGEFVAIMFKTIGIELLLNFALTAVLVLIAMVVRNLGGVIAIDIIGVFSLGSLIYIALELLVDGKIKFTQYSLMNNISFYNMNTTAMGSDYLRSTIVAVAFLVITTILGIVAFKKSDVK